MCSGTLEHLKASPVDNFRIITEKTAMHPLRPYQKTAVENWQEDDTMSNMLEVKEAELYYINTQGARQKLVALAAAQG